MKWDKGLDFEETYKTLLKSIYDNEKPQDIILLIQLRNGSRIGEAVAAAKEYCRTKSREVTVEVEKGGGYLEGNKRFMVMPEEVPNALLNMVCEWLSKVTDPTTAVKVWAKRKYGWNTHSLRYAFITHLLALGYSPIFISKITGHRSLRNLSEYAEITKAEEILKSLRGKK